MATAAAPRATRTTSIRNWSRALYDAGYIGLTWPKEYGGGGKPYSYQAIFLEETARAEAPQHLGVIGLGMAGPTIIALGTEAQKARYLQPLLSADEIWCQGFSEPGAGSDLSAVRTSARLEGSHFVVDGQKVWSSYAHIADWCILVTRSDPASERHAGLTYLIVDMKAPGVEVRPLRQITGEAEFNEIFFTGVEVPVENVIGEVGGGWQVAMTTLLHERGTLGFALTAALEVMVGKLIELARDRGATPLQRDAIAREWIELQALRYTAYRSLSALMKTGIPGPEGSILKQQWSEAAQRADEARARAARPRCPAPRRERAVRRLLAAHAAPQPRQHDRGRHLGDPAQHHRRARARAAEVALAPWISRSRPSRRSSARRRARSSRPIRSRPGRSSRSSAGPASRSRRRTAAPGSASSRRRSCSRRWDARSPTRRTGRPSPSRCRRSPPTCRPRLRAARRAGRSPPARSSRISTPRPASPTSAATRSGSSREPSARCSRRTTRRGRSASSRAARPGGELASSELLPQLRSRSLTALALEACGVGARALELAVAYAGEREQFGKPIGTYQAISHPLATTLMELELGRSLALFAAWCIAEDDDRTPIAAASAKSLCADAAVAACERSIQVHGGIGFTWEHVLHRLYKRALWIQSWEASGRPASLRGGCPSARRRRRVTCRG